MIRHLCIIFDQIGPASIDPVPNTPSPPQPSPAAARLCRLRVPVRSCHAVVSSSPYAPCPRSVAGAPETFRVGGALPGAVHRRHGVVGGGSGGGAGLRAQAGKGTSAGALWRASGVCVVARSLVWLPFGFVTRRRGSWLVGRWGPRSERPMGLVLDSVTHLLSVVLLRCLSSLFAVTLLCALAFCPAVLSRADFFWPALPPTPGPVCFHCTCHRRPS